jgi:hypothetical protein
MVPSSVIWVATIIICPNNTLNIFCRRQDSYEPKRRGLVLPRVVGYDPWGTSQR